MQETRRFAPAFRGGQTPRWLPMFGLVLAGALLVSVPSLAANDAYPSAEATRPLAVGEAVPEAVVESVSGERIDLRKLVRKQSALLVFYRGGW
jgi:hypothetical protein